MAYKNTEQTYGSVSKFLHWLIFLAVLIMLCLGFSFGYVDDKALKGQLYHIHKLLGLGILVIMVVRLLWALTNPKPHLPKSAAAWERVAERSVHGLFYVVLIAMPIIGLIMSSAVNKGPLLFGFKIQLPITQSKPLAELMSNIHEILAWVLLALIVIHVAAALKHAVINKDDVLQRMLPGWKT